MRTTEESRTLTIDVTRLQPTLRFSVYIYSNANGDKVDVQEFKIDLNQKYEKRTTTLHSSKPEEWRVSVRREIEKQVYL